MGVVYKLKKEVLDFILEKKKENPAISCRKLVSVVYARFELKLSKSSINSILQKAHLSSPVGRPAIEGGRTSLKRNSLSQVVQGKLSAEEKKGRFSAGIIREKPLEPVAQEPQQETPKVPEIEKAAPEQQEEKKKEKARQDILYDGMGCIFLKAAEWELSNTSILGRLIQEHIKEDQGVDIDAAAETFLFMEPFGIKNIEGLSQYTQQGLWALNGIKEKIDPGRLFNLARNINNLKELWLDFSIEIPTIFSELYYIKMLLEDGTAVWLDAKMTAVWPQNTPSLFSQPMNKVMTMIARQFFNNVPSAVFYSTSPLIRQSQDQEEARPKCFSEEFHDMVFAFENVAGKRIVKIIACDDQQQEMTCFDEIPEKKRIFIAGVWPGQAGFQCLHAKGEDAICIEVPSSGDSKGVTRLYVVPAQGEIPALRAILLKKSSQEDPFLALITNASCEEMPSHEMLSSYIERWPRLGREWADQPEESQKERQDNMGEDIIAGHSIPEICDISGLVRAFFSMLEHFCEKRFFSSSEKLSGKNVSSVMSDIYKIPGYLCVDETKVKVSFVLSEKDYPCKEILESAIMQVNASAAYDPSGRKLILESICN